MSTPDKPTTPQLCLELDRLTADECELLSGIVQAVRRGQHVVTLPGQKVALHRIELKLQARKPPREGGA